MEKDQKYMRRAIELAGLGRGRVSPNPMVGCVIVHDDQIIGEGWHDRFGEAHAEVNAIQAVADQGLLNRSTVYVNLEPCAHQGKTPPCTDLLLEKQVGKVVISHQDPNPLVGGKGIKRLRDAGIKVKLGVLEGTSRELNVRFLTSLENARPYVVLKWAQTQDGFIARKNYDSKWISNEQSRKLVHKWRSEEDAILVGTNTAHHDNPKLNVREWEGKDPARVVIDRHLRLDPGLHVFDGTQPTICYNLERSEVREGLEYVSIPQTEFVQLLLKDLHTRQIQSVLVEGGSQILSEFIRLQLWDEARVFTSAVQFKEGIKAPTVEGTALNEMQLNGDLLQLYASK